MFSMMDTPAFIIVKSRIRSLRNLRGNVLAGTFVLMKEDFGVSKCSTSNPNTRYYPSSLWCDLNGGALGWVTVKVRYVHDTRKGGSRKTRSTTETSGSGVVGKRGFPSRTRGNSPLITAREKTRTEIYRWHRYFSCTYIGLDDLLYIVHCRSLSIKLFCSGREFRGGIDANIIYRHNNIE